MSTTTAPATTSEPTHETRAWMRWIILGVVLAADVLDLIDSSITTVAAPTIARDLHGGHGLIQWLSASYALALGVLLVVGARLGDKFGARRMFLVGVVGFTLASAACGLSISPEMIIVSRLVQGAFGALLIPQGFGILTRTFPREEMGKAFSAFGPVLGISAVGGPILAGFLIKADLFGLTWRPMFLINIVIGILTFTGAVLFLPRIKGTASTVIDGLGSLLLAGTMLGLLYGLIEGSNVGWTLVPYLSMAAGVILFVLFCVRQRVAADPLIEPSLLKNKGFTSGLILGLVFFAVVAGLLYVISLFLQGALHYTAFSTSLQLAPLAVGIIGASFASFGLIQKLGRILTFVGLLFTLAGAVWLFALVSADGLAVSAWALVPPLFVIGLGMGSCFGSIYDVAIGDIQPSEAGSASGSLSAVQQLANSLGAAAVTTVYFKVLIGSGAPSAVLVCLGIVGAVTLIGCGLVWLLPKKPQPEVEG
jgi:EmrB/QacA subfamily drug resistance transporter